MNIAKQLRQLMRFLGLLSRPKAKPTPTEPAPVPEPVPAPQPEPTPIERPVDLRGQFVIYTRNPWAGDPRFPRALPDRFFMAELDAVWDQKPDEAERIIAEYKALGCNHVTVGPIKDVGYHYHYPDVDWTGNIERFAEFLRWLLAHGVEFTLFALPDNAPFFETPGRGWDMAAVSRVFAAPYARLGELVEIRRVVSAWEQWGPGANMVQVFRWLRRTFPGATDLLWHNGVGHLGPCLGTEFERGGMTSNEAWRAIAAEGCTGLALQTWPLNSTIPSHDGTPPLSHLDMLAYDIWDMRRRFVGEASPWGGPIVSSLSGQPLTVEYMEGCAYAQYWTDTARDIGPAWRQAALDAGARFALDGAPKL